MRKSSEQSGKFLPIRGADPESGAPVETEFLFASPAMRAVYDVALQIASSDAGVLISGETGVGKELLAQCIHKAARRAKKPFTAVNCGMLKGELFADKFFGHEAGAFTGALKPQRGVFEIAGDGTLFLDEVGEIPLQNQVDFLRVLEERSFHRLGGEKIFPFAARVVAATNRDLPAMIRSGDFRADLHYRLNVAPLVLPPLRERPEDVGFLAEFFLSTQRIKLHKPHLAFSPRVLDRFRDYDWPGNVRELKNLVERLALLSKDDDIKTRDLPTDMHPGARAGAGPFGPAGSFGRHGDAEPVTLREAVYAAKRRAVLAAFAKAGGDRTETAQILDISPRTLRWLVRELDIELKR